MEVVQSHDFALAHVQQQLRYRRLPFLRITFFAIVKNAEFREPRQEFDQPQLAARVSFAHLRLRDVVASECDARPHASQVQFRAFESHIPNADFDSPRDSFTNQGRYRVSPERGLEGKILPPLDGSIKEATALLPGRSICFVLGNSRYASKELRGHLVRVEEFHASLRKHRSADTALPRSIYAGQNVNARCFRLVTHACAQTPLQRSRVVSETPRTPLAFPRARAVSAYSQVARRIHRSIR